MNVLLPTPGHAGDADAPRFAGMRQQPLQHFLRLRLVQRERLSTSVMARASIARSPAQHAGHIIVRASEAARAPAQVGAALAGCRSVAGARSVIQSRRRGLASAAY